jgi:hypothetical protein
MVVQLSTRSRSHHTLCGARSAVHESPRTTKLHDRTNDTINLDEIERILIQAFGTVGDNSWPCRSDSLQTEAPG